MISKTIGVARSQRGAAPFCPTARTPLATWLGREVDCGEVWRGDRGGEEPRELCGDGWKFRADLEVVPDGRQWWAFALVIGVYVGVGDLRL